MVLQDYVYDLGFSSTSKYRDYVMEIMSLWSRDLERLLGEKIVAARREKPRVERKLSDGHEVFEIRAYIIGSNILVRSPSGIEIPLRIAANTGMAVRKDTVYLYMRLSSLGGHPIPNPWSRTFIGLAKTSLDKLHGSMELEAKPILYPLLSTERVEDPRVDPDNMTELYHVRAYSTYKEVCGADSYVITFRSDIGNDGVPDNMEPVLFRSPDGSLHIIRSYRDTFPLNKEYMVTRPWIEEMSVGAIMIGPREKNIVDARELRAYPELTPTSSERKTGGNCTAKISSNEYLLFFHSVEAYFGGYYTYAAIMDGNGELLGLTPEPIISPRVNDYIGARPATVFVCGAQLVGDKVLVTAGKDDEITLVMEASLDSIIEKIKFIKG